MLKIIIPNYNKGSYLKDLFDSLYSQLTEKDLIIFVDDNSTDNSVDILRSHPIAEKTNLILNTGNRWWCAKARNSGLEYINVNEDWFCFIDSDDYVLPNFIETLHGYIEENKAPIYCYKCDVVLEDNQENIGMADRMAIYTRLYRGDVQGKVHFLESKKFKKSHCGEDIDFVIKAVKEMKEVIYTDDIIYHYRLGVPKGESELSGMSWDKKKEYWRNN